jgi:flagella basal body P-ring formation protein FlgA
MRTLVALIVMSAVAGSVSAEGIRVHTPGGILTAAALEGAVREHLTGADARDGVARAVEFQGTPDSLPVGGQFCRVDPGLAGDARLRGAVHLPVAVTGGSGVRRVVTMLAVVRTFALLPVASRRLERHAEIGAGAWDLRRIETTTLSEGVVRSGESLAGRRTARLVEAGSPFFEHVLEDVPVVRRGETVTLVVRRGGVRLSTPAVAREDGTAGTLITVRRQGVRAPVRARVVDARTVAVDVQ